MKEQRRQQILAAIELSLIPGIGITTQGRLWKRCPELRDLIKKSARELESSGVPAEQASAVNSRRYQPMAEEIWDWTQREGCGILIRGELPYPSLLDEIHDVPLLMYFRGDPEILKRPCVAIVGTRRPTYYGLQMAQGLALDLGKRGVAIVSGLARGIDAAAHRGCLEGGGATVAVLGCGIDLVYPREHGMLTRQIAETGLLLSEFPPGTCPAPQNFPIRNRIISGVSLGALIVEASEYSGSLITARLALEQNREVFAVPGNLTSPQSFGPNYLIKQGAKLVQVWRDVVEELPSEVRHRILAEEDSRPRRAATLDLTSAEESKILEMLSFDQAIQFDKILARSGQNVSHLSDLLLNLEMRGMIRQVPGNLFVRVAPRGDS